MVIKIYQPRGRPALIVKPLLTSKLSQDECHVSAGNKHWLVAGVGNIDLVSRPERAFRNCITVSYGVLRISFGMSKVFFTENKKIEKSTCILINYEVIGTV